MRCALNPTSEVAQRIVQLLRQGPPLSFYAILKALPDVEYRTILQAWGTLREQDILGRDPDGNYLIRDGAPER